MEVSMMDCRDIKNLIIECDGRLEKLGLASDRLAEVKAHIAACKDCAFAMERMARMMSAISGDRVEVPKDLAADIIAKVLPSKQKASAPAKPAQALVSEPPKARPSIEEPGFIDRIAAALGLTRDRFAFAAGLAGLIAVVAISYALMADKGTESRIAIKKDVIIEQPAENKFKKAPEAPREIAVAPQTPQAPDKKEQKFKKSLFTIEAGKIAGGVTEPRPNTFYSVSGVNDLRLAYKGAATINLKVESKFKMTDTGLVIKNGIAQIEVTPKALAVFTVTTPDAFVEVTGTKFTVSRINEETEVAVAAGSVRVTDMQNGEVANLAAGAKKVVSKKAAAKKINEVEAMFDETPAETAAVELTTGTAEIGIAPLVTVEINVESNKINDMMNKLKNGGSEIK